MKPLSETVLIKKPNTKETFSESQLREVIKCADPVSGPAYFLSNYFYIQHPLSSFFCRYALVVRL